MAKDRGDIDDLAARIDAANSEKKEKAERVRNRSGHTGTQAATEFVLSILLGGYLGYLLDGQLGTAPLFLILLFFVGCGAGFMSLYRANKKMGSAIGYSELHREEKQGKTLPKNTDDVPKNEE